MKVKGKAAIIRTVIIVIIVITAVLITLFIADFFIYRDSYIKPQDIDYIVVDITRQPVPGFNELNAIKITDKTEIDIFMTCVKKIRKNNIERDYKIEISEENFTFIYHMKNNSVISVSHKIYYSTYEYLMAPFYKLPSVIKQIKPLFSTDGSSVKSAKVVLSELDTDTNLGREFKIADNETLTQLFSYVLADIESYDSKDKNDLGTISFYDSDEELIGFYLISDTFYNYNEMFTLITEPK